jgi:uncharacterized protein YdhG (YjbR/CyaY superfamily)
VSGAASVDAYIASFPPEVQQVLESVRATIRAAVPGAEERISYGIPTLALDGRSVVHFSAWKHHVAVYPVPDAAADPALARELAAYRAGKGTLRFPLDEPLPLALIGRVAVGLRSRHERSGKADRDTDSPRVP